MKKNSLTSAHYSHGQDIVTPNGVMQYATPAYVHAGVTHTSVPYGSTGDSGVETPMHEQFATETDEDPTIIGDYDPSFQLILRRHGLTAMPRDSDPDREWLEVLEAGDTSISMPSSLLNDLDHDPSHPTTTVMYASPALVQSTTASSTSGPASSTKEHSPSKSPTGAHSPKSTSPVTDNSTGSSVVVIDIDEAREATAATTGPIFTRKESPRKKEDALEIDAVSSAAVPDPWQLLSLIHI